MRFTIVLSLLSLSVVSFAQRYNIEIIGLKTGLLHSLVTGIDQDTQGKVWLSTGGGLCNYNGFEFKYLTTRDGLNYTRLTDVAVDAEGNIWASSSLGLNMVRGNRILTIPKDTIGEVASLGKSSNGVWVLSNRGVFRVAFSKDKFDIIQYSLPVNLNVALSPIFQDRPLTDFVFQSTLNKVYVGHKGTLYKLSNESFSPLTFEPSVYVNACSENANGDVFVATSDGLYRLVDDKPIKVNHPYASRIDILKFVCIGSKIWCNGKLKGSDEVSIHAFDLEDESFNRTLGVKNGLPDIPSKLYVDHEHNIWILTNNGIAILKGEAFTCLTTNDGLIGNKIWGICRVSDGTLWAGTIGEGLSVISPTRIYQYSTKNGLPDNYVGKIFESSSRKIYVGTSNAGLNLATYINSTLGYSFNRLPLLPNDRVRIDDIAEDRQKRIWVATSKGLFYATDGIHFNHFPLFDSDTGGVFVQKLQIDTLRKRMWVGTRFNGIFFIENDKPFKFTGIDKNAEISTIVQDFKGDIWFGTRNSGGFSL
ncbi:ligand-binding sensor domain-containing protein [Tenuifilum sp.]|uniref:ligand-binding sensor domain-containing protein n=1 Tax=Tenuifilum sp. TaxID=2760880 RepID=UPI002CC6750B|nr:two-component regulator propeller domain-containing protein [Tenuifilum sp.]HOK84966.1 two-component regulator propeller domain-containing protein [Tenuifilum sp.]HPP89257.1 two-component regulator propeller domain-containing protein [Tenuifilum sp.]